MFQIMSGNENLQYIYNFLYNGITLTQNRGNFAPNFHNAQTARISNQDVYVI